MCIVLDNDDQEAQSMLPMEAQPCKTDSKPKQMTSNSLQEKKGKAKIKQIF